MRLENLFYELNLYEILDSLLADFVLAFAFFTSMTYAVLGKKFEKQRPAIAMSAVMGFALSTGLVWWERAHDYSIKDLGPIAIGFAILLLAFVMYQSIRQVGGSLGGAGITIGAAIIIAKLLGLNIPVDWQIVQTIVVVALIFGLLAFMSHRHHRFARIRPTKPNLPDIKHTMANLHRERHLSKKLDHGLRKLRKEAKTIDEHPEEATNISLQIKRMLPAQGYLTEKMAQLRTTAHRVRNGHIARLEETRHVFAKLPTAAKKKASAELAARYNQMIGIDTRLERLDRTVAENEKRIRLLTQQAQQNTAKYDYQKLVGCLKQAEKLQHHNSKLIKTIDRTEGKLTSIAKDAARQVKQVNKE
jgi:endonuclease III